MENVLTFVGIDISKARLDVASHPAGATQSVANDATGIETLVEQLHAVKPMLIVLEATEA
jgi:transposase